MTGGVLGSKNAVLVFRTSALANLNDLSPESDHYVPLKPLKCVPSADASSKESNRLLDQCRPRSKLTPANLNVFKKRLKGQPNDSLSSSENSISSAEAESEADQHNVDGRDCRERFVSATSDYGGKSSASAAATRSQPTNASSSSMENEMSGSGGGGDNDDDDEDTYISEMPAAVLKLTYKFTNTETKLLRRILSSHGLQEANESQIFNLLWTGLHMKPDILRNLTPYQRINHFPR